MLRYASQAQPTIRSAGLVSSPFHAVVCLAVGYRTLTAAIHCTTRCHKHGIAPFPDCLYRTTYLQE